MAAGCVEYGFDEFLSADYMCVTMGALLNVVDFAPEEESAQASALLDRLFHSFACHCFQGEIIAPQGAFTAQCCIRIRRMPRPSCTFWIPTAPWPCRNG